MKPNIKISLALILVVTAAIAGLHIGIPQERNSESFMFLRQIADHHAALSLAESRTIASISEVGEVGFVSLAQLIPGQDEISVDNVKKKIDERQAEGHIEKDPATGKWLLKFDHGNSAVPADDAIQIIKGPQGYIIIDGHHDLMLALHVGAKTIAAKLVDDFSSLEPLEFWRLMKSRNLVYLKASAQELAQMPPTIPRIRDNPNRYYVSVLALKVNAEVNLDKDSVKIAKVKGSDRALWLKLNDSVPFIEFHIARALSEARLTYKSEWGNDIPTQFIERSRQVLRAASRSPKYPELHGVYFFESSDGAGHALMNHHNLVDILKWEETMQLNHPRSCWDVFSRK